MFNFKKLSAIGSSALMMGLTIGTAAAASFPAPFVVGGNADVAIVYGAGADSLDSTQASALSTTLGTALSSATSGGVVQNVVGESESLDTSADRIWLNTSLNAVKSTLTDTDLPNTLEDSSFDGDVTADVISSIKLLAGNTAGGDNSGKVIFAKQPTTNTDPEVGVSLGSSATSSPLYNASVTFSKAVNFTDDESEGETVTMFGRDFVVSTDTDGTDLVLFASAEEVTLSATGAGTTTATVNVGGVDYAVTLLNGDSSSADIQVGTDSDSINEGDSKKVGGIEVAVKDVTSSEAVGITATLLVGSEKLTITSGTTVTKGAEDDPVDGTFAYLVGGTTATTEIAVAVFRPDSSSDAIVAGESFEDPVFGNFKFDFAGLNSPLDDSDREMISVQNSGDKSMTVTFTDEDGSEGTVEFAHNNTYASAQLDTVIYKNAHWRLSDDNNDSIWVVEGANLTEQDYVVLGNEEYGHMFQVTQIYNNTGASFGDDKVKLEDVMSGETHEVTFTSEGNGQVTLDGKTYTASFLGTGDGGRVTFKYPTSDSATTSTFVMYPTIETETGAQVQLVEPLNFSLAAFNGTTAQPLILNMPDGDGYTSITFTYGGGGVVNSTWTVSSGSSTFALNATGDSTANYTAVTIGTVRYNFSSIGTNVNRTTITMIDPEGNANIDQPALVLWEGEDDDDNYHVVVVDLETAPAGTGDSGVGVNDVLFSSDKYHASATLDSDSDVTQDVDWWGMLVETDATESDQKTVEIAYPESQVYAQMYIGELSSVVSSGTGGATLGDVIVTDAEVSSVQSKNLIVVGGSCINSVAAELLGGSLCTAAFTEATGVGTGQFLIESFGDAYTDGKIALLVAGYNAADTANAATYLRTQTVDTSAGKKYIGSTSTSAELQVN